NMIAVLDDGYGRVVFDTSFTRLIDNIKPDAEPGDTIRLGDTPQYVVNIAKWLGHQTKIDLYDVSFIQPLTNRDTFRQKSTIPIKFTVRNKETGKFIKDKSVTIEIYDDEDNLVKRFEYGREKGDVRIIGKHYQINWDTKGFDVGEYTIVIDFDLYCSQLEKEITLKELSKGRGHHCDD
ncbi:MAG: hypothetical protein ACFFG0_56000, partial [Candidatus Thorarchaeota archaeon]